MQRKLLRKIKAIARAPLRAAGGVAKWCSFNPLYDPNDSSQITFRRPRAASVLLSDLLMGGDNGLTGEQFGRLTGDLCRASTRIAESPHAKLLKEWQAIGDDVFSTPHFSRTEYFRNAALNIDIFGFYFDARCECDIVKGARRFIDCFKGSIEPSQLSEAQSLPSEAIRVRPIKFSNCYQVVDGHHRLAIAAVKGLPSAKVMVEPLEVLTPIQRLALDVLWLRGRKELYQPLSMPELQRDWVLVRTCDDRLRKMKQFLRCNGIEVRTYIDIACSYGWFVFKMQEFGLQAEGVERDPFALSLGRAAYGLSDKVLHRSDSTRFLRESSRRYDVTSCFSLLHHYVMSNGARSPEELIRLLDRATGKVLFFETGEEHESEWYGDELRGWNPSFIQKWVLDNTSFTKVENLGADHDRKDRSTGCLGRTLFAFTRT